MEKLSVIINSKKTDLKDFRSTESPRINEDYIKWKKLTGVNCS